MKADKVEVNNEHVNLVPLIGKFVEGFRDSAANKNLELLYECSIDAIDVFIDTTILKQIVNNLINNAIKFTPAGGVFVSLDLLEQNALESIVLKVKDTGIGISDEHQSIIWDEFRQVSEGMSRVFEGAGLGLTITKMFVEKLGGRISVQSKLGVGTEFTVILQSSGETAPGKQPAGSIIPSATKQSTAARPSILMVEDDKISIDLIQMFLGRDYEMVVAKDGKTALALVKEKKYDAILMDINLGHGMSGVDVTRAIRQLAGYQSVPIVAVTAYAMDGDRNEFINAGCTHYISKPFSRKEFLRLISGLFT
jgi:CheY-like chemotaxis protein